MFDIMYKFLYSANEAKFLLETNEHAGCATKAWLFKNGHKGWLLELITSWLNSDLLGFFLFPFEIILTV